MGCCCTKSSPKTPSLSPLELPPFNVVAGSQNPITCSSAPPVLAPGIESGDKTKKTLEHDVPDEDESKAISPPHVKLTAVAPEGAPNCQPKYDVPDEDESKVESPRRVKFTTTTLVPEGAPRFTPYHRPGTPKSHEESGEDTWQEV